MEGAALPPGVLALVFEYLSPTGRLQARRVCRDWRGAVGIGCAHLHVEVNRPASSGVDSFKVGRVRLRGRRSKLSLERDDVEAREATFDSARWMNRTRGHLPQPIVLDVEQDLEETVPHGLQQTRGGAALLIDRSAVSLRCQLEVEATGAGGKEPNPVPAPDDSDDSDEDTNYEREQAAQARRVTVLDSLDLTASTFHPCVRIQDGIDSYRDTNPRTLRHALRKVDLGGLCWLRSLSVRGCGNLQMLLVPPSLTALDASGASKLRTLNYGHNDSIERAGCQVLNLNGCRELRCAGLLAYPQSLAHCRELDLSYCQRLPAATVATALQTAGALASLSLRNIAKELTLLRLAASPAAARTLRLVDCAFSADMSDAAVEALVQAAGARLQRINLRGCTSVSTSCYNQTPITLMTRCSAKDKDKETEPEPAAGSTSTCTMRSHAEDGTPFESPEPVTGCKLRKGDNVFFFTSR